MTPRQEKTPEPTVSTDQPEKVMVEASFHFGNHFPVFNVRDGLRVRRRPTGDVRIEFLERGPLYLTEHEWASIVAFLSRDGENAETFKAALSFYNGDPNPSGGVVVSEEMVEAAAEALWNEREFRDPSGEEDGLDPDSPRRTPYLWAQMVAEGKFKGDQRDFRSDARAALQAALGVGVQDPEEETKEHGEPAPQLPFLYGREQGEGSFADALDNLLADLRGLLRAANPGQQIVIDREHIDRDGFYFVARAKPYLTEVQFRAAAATNPSPEEAGDA